MPKKLATRDEKPRAKKFPLLGWDRRRANRDLPAAFTGGWNLIGRTH